MRTVLRFNLRCFWLWVHPGPGLNHLPPAQSHYSLFFIIPEADRPLSKQLLIFPLPVGLSHELCFVCNCILHAWPYLWAPTSLFHITIKLPSAWTAPGGDIVITIIITGATQQSDREVWRLPRMLHTTSAHRRGLSGKQSLGQILLLSQLVLKEKIQIRGCSVRAKEESGLWAELAGSRFPPSSHSPFACIVISWVCTRPPSETGHFVSQPASAADFHGSPVSPSLHTAKPSHAP